jgi:Zn-dependent peptidase ImmA (M78 family)
MFLSKVRIEEIETASSSILEDVFSNDISIPIDLDKILSFHKIKLKSGDFKNSNIAGAYHRDSKTIFIPKGGTYQRNVFTIAHELGHYILHKDVPNEVFYRLDAELISSQEKDIQETEANWFAASLLMPKSKLSEFADLLKNHLEEMATVFGVSKKAMFWRYKNTRGVKA